MTATMDRRRALIIEQEGSHKYVHKDSINEPEFKFHAAIQSTRSFATAYKKKIVAIEAALNDDSSPPVAQNAEPTSQDTIENDSDSEDSDVSDVTTASSIISPATAERWTIVSEPRTALGRALEVAVACMNKATLTQYLDTVGIKLKTGFPRWLFRKVLCDCSQHGQEYNKCLRCEKQICEVSLDSSNF